MITTIIKISTIFILFIIGFLLKKRSLLDTKKADFFLKIVFNITVPAIILKSITTINLSREIAYLPLISMVIVLLSLCISFMVSKLIVLPKKTKGVFIIASSIMNIGFTLPFVFFLKGDDCLAKILIFDSGNAFLIFTLLYYIACSYGNSLSETSMFKRLLLSPPLIVIILSLILNYLDITPGENLSIILEIIGTSTIPLLMISLGIYFNPVLKKPGIVFLIIILRSGAGIILGITAVEILSLNGIIKTVILTGACSPVGYNTLTFSSIQNLDTELAAEVVSYSILLGMIYIPLVLIFC